MPTVKANDINIYYEIHGEGEPLLMIQGYGQYSGHWTTLIPPFAKEYRVIIFDNRGTGRTDKPETPYTMKMMAADAKGLLDAIGIDKANTFGVSMGGMIAQEFAINYPERVISLILGCTECGGKNAVPQTKEALNFLFGPEMAKLSAVESARQTPPWLWNQEFIDKHPKAVEFYIETTAKFPTPPHGYASQSRTIRSHDTYDRLPQIKAPTLVITGDADRIIPAGNSKILASRIPGAELVMLKNSGHGFFGDAAAESIRAILDFLKRNSKGKKKA
jgi:pimeloyl-ACP methyl ester carboxylesterase